MRELTAHGILIRSVAPIWIDEYVAWCNERDDDSADEGPASPEPLLPLEADQRID